jgi:hypothetical protein
LRLLIRICWLDIRQWSHGNSQTGQGREETKSWRSTTIPAPLLHPKETIVRGAHAGAGAYYLWQHGTAKAASTFNLNIEAISEHIANRLKFDGPLAALAVRELKAPTINFPNNLTDPTNLVETTKWQRNFNHAYNQQKWWDENTQKIYNLVM